MSCELGGEGKLSLRSLELGWTGVLRILVEQGVLGPQRLERFGVEAQRRPTQFLDFGASQTVTSGRHALAAPLVELGETVGLGQALVRLSDPFDLSAEPEVLTAAAEGCVAIRRREVLVRPGDHILQIAPFLSEADVNQLL